MAFVKTLSVVEAMRKNPELKESDLDMLKDWLKKQPHLPPMSDSELVLFLHSNYYRIEPTKTAIDVFFTVRSHVPEFFSNRDPLSLKDLRKAMNVTCCVPLPSTTPEGYTIILTRLMDSDPSHYSANDAAKIFCMVVELWLYTAASTSPGQIVVMDMEGTMFGHLPRMSPMVTKKLLYYVQEALPLRLKSLHVINTLPFVDLFFNIAKPFLKKEFLDMLSFHSSSNTLSKVIPIDLLPNDQGGKAGPLNDLWAAEKEKLEEHRAWFIEEESRKVNEALRPGKAKNPTDLLGTEGSFKTLEID